MKHKKSNIIDFDEAKQTPERRRLKALERLVDRLLHGHQNDNRPD